jgi:hypothetical protein
VQRLDAAVMTGKADDLEQHRRRAGLGHARTPVMRESGAPR